MKTILLAALVLGFYGLANAAEEKKEVDPVGTFSAVRVFMDNKIPIDYKLTITGDKLQGKGSAEFGGNKQEFDIQGKREKKDK